MGGQLSQPFGKEIQHPKFGLISVDNRNATQHMICSFPVSDQLNRHDWEQRLKSTRQARYTQSMLLSEHHSLESVPCGLFNTLKIRYPFFPFDLEFQINNRIRVGVFFKESELYHLLYTLLGVSNQFEKTNHKSGNIQPSNILINSSGDLKVITTSSYPGMLDNYKAALWDREKGLLAPQELVQLKKRCHTPDYSQPKSQAFSIGMTLLSTALLSNLLSLYHMEDYGFDETSFRNTLKAWMQPNQYSSFLKQLILMLVAHNPVDRVSPGQLYAYLSPYDDPIKKGQSFHPDQKMSLDALKEYTQHCTLQAMKGRHKLPIHPLGSKLRHPQSLTKEKTVQRLANNRMTQLRERTEYQMKRQKDSHTIKDCIQLQHHPQLVIVEHKPQGLTPEQLQGNYPQSDINVQAMVMAFRASLSTQDNVRPIRLSNNREELN